MIWELAQIDERPDTLNFPYEVETIPLPDSAEMEIIEQEWGILGMSLRDHPMMLYRDALTKQGILSSQDLAAYPDKKELRIAGMMLIRQAPPTAKGYQFITLEDEFGFINVIVRPEIAARYRKLLRETLFFEVRGRSQREGAIMNVLANGFMAMRV